MEIVELSSAPRVVRTESWSPPTNGATGGWSEEQQAADTLEFVTETLVETQCRLEQAEVRNTELVAENAKLRASLTTALRERDFLSQAVEALDALCQCYALVSGLSVRQDSTTHPTRK